LFFCNEFTLFSLTLLSARAGNKSPLMKLMIRRDDKVFNKFTTATQESSRPILYSLFTGKSLCHFYYRTGRRTMATRGTPSNIEHHRGPHANVPTNVLQPAIA